MNDLLRAMGSGAGSDEAFIRVYGHGLRDLQEDAMARMRQRYGGD
jgi:hypothetical protein